MERLSLYAIATGAVALVIALVLYFRVKSAPEGNERMAMIAKYIREGAMAFLVREYKVLAIYSAVVSSLLFVGFNGKGLGVHSAVAFLSGAGLSLLAGFFGMKAATYANVRTTEAARTKGKSEALVMALDGGAVMGLCVAGLGLIGLGVILQLFGGAEGHVFGTVIHSFAVGASSIALFARIGGGIYTK